MSNPNEEPAPRRQALGDAIQARPSPDCRQDAEFTVVPPAIPDVPTVSFELSPLLDRDIFEKVPLPIWSILYLLLALASGWFAYAGNWAATAVLAPIGVSLALVYSYDYFHPRRFRISARGLESSRPRAFIEFDVFQEVARGAATETRDEFPIYVVSAKGLVSIPDRLTCNTRELWELLRSRVPSSLDHRPVPPLFDAFLKQQQLIYPPEQIHIFRGSAKPKRPTATRSILKFTLALLLPLPIWIGLAIAHPRQEAFFVMSVVFGVFAFIFGLVALGTSFGGSRRIKNADEAVLIITPDGLALSQAELRGELRWSEVRKIRHPGMSHGFQLTAPAPGLALRVQGADIVIADIYDWPIEAIVPLVKRYSGL